MFILDLYNKIKYDSQADRIGPDVPFTHWKLYFLRRMKKLCQNKFGGFSGTSEVRPGAYIVGCSQIYLGEKVVIRPGCRLFGESLNLKRSIIIEDNVLLGSGVNIYVNNHEFKLDGVDIVDQGFQKAEPVILRKGCWIGANSIILPGVEIGENTIIGAGSVVTKSFPSRVVAGGNPAKVIKRLITQL